jgi:glycosyltransferase involved in cell wall biosynthesis
LGTTEAAASHCEESTTSSRPLVSIIMIFFNGEPFIDEAIRSILFQTYENWELILVDDGSTDFSPRIAERHVSENAERMRLLRHPQGENRGMSQSRNLGLKNARGDFIAFLDADDVWLPEKLSTQVPLLASKPDIGMVYGPALTWHSWHPQPQARDRHRLLGVTPDTDQHPCTIMARILLRKAESPGTCSVLIRKSVAEAVGGFEPEFTGMFEDQAFFSKILLRFPVHVHSASLDRYRQHDQGTCIVAKKTGEYDPHYPNPAERRFLDWLRNHVDSINIDSRKLEFALRVARYRTQFPLVAKLMLLHERLWRRFRSIQTGHQQPTP